ncbi:DUF305 domain-containing protein [Singulisphaera rosea]
MNRPNSGQVTNRREFLKTVGLGLASTMVPAALGRSAFAAAPGVRPKIAAVVTEFTFRSHGHVILENFVNPYLFNGTMTDPGVDIVSLYIDQTPRRDLAREAATRYKIPIFPTIAEAVRVGGKDLAVDGVRNFKPGKAPDEIQDLKELRSQRGVAFDRAFLTMMTDHHMMAIEGNDTGMVGASEARTRAAQQGIRALAGNIVATQTREISEMQGILARLGGSSMA